MHVAVVGLVVAQTGPALWASDAVETAGDVLEAVLPAAAAGVGLWQKDWDGLLHFGYSLGNSFALTEGTKALVERERPDLSDHDSYVSGHTATAFSGAVFLDRRYLSDRPLWLRAVPYGGLRPLSATAGTKPTSITSGTSLPVPCSGRCRSMCSPRRGDTKSHWLPRRPPAQPVSVSE